MLLFFGLATEWGLIESFSLSERTHGPSAQLYILLT